MIAAQAIHAAVAENLPEAVDHLCRLMAFPSLSGQEHEAMLHLEQVFSDLGLTVERVPMRPDLLRDPDYSSPIPGLAMEGRFNLRVVCPGRSARKIILNAHVDVVPLAEGMAWGSRREGETIFGRGACDDKGPLITLWLVAATLTRAGVEPPCEIVLHLVNEEENGGNGSLQMIRHGERADACIVMEPTEGRVFSSIRGAVWFRIDFRGQAGHSGQPGVTRSALTMAREAMTALEDYHRRLLAESAGLPLFEAYPNPMPLTFGRLEAGNWPAAAPQHARLEGVLGFLPNRTRDQVCAELRAALLDAGQLKADDFELGFTYRHDCSMLDPEHFLARDLVQAARQAGYDSRIDAMTASCDAWFYNNQLSIPTVVFGPGSLRWAHTREEQIAIPEIARAAEAILLSILNSTGLRDDA